jgi:hypothetical protein
VVEQKNPRERFREAEDAISRIVASANPAWSARDELSKTLISISSAAVVLTVALAKPLAISSQSYFWQALPYISWTAFLVTIVASILALWFSVTVRELGIRFLNERQNMLQAMVHPNPSLENPYQAVDDILNRVLKPNEKDAWAEYCVKASLISFGVALIVLGIIGWRQLIA